MNILDKIMKPRSIAVVGASTKQHTIGSDIMKRLREYGYAGPVYPVNPKGGVIEGLPAYATVLDIPGEVDLAVIIVNARFVLQTIDQCHEKGIKGLCVISAGFKETGTEGARLEAELLERVRRYGMRCVGPNCLGVVNTHPAVRMDACFAEALPERGNIGFVSQSGALGGGILNILRDLNLGFAQFISIGNQADVNAETALEYWEGDEDVRQILLYMESIQNPANFRRIASRLSKKKPVLALKAGRSAAGASAASSHTGSLAGADLAADVNVPFFMYVEEAVEGLARLNEQRLWIERPEGVLPDFKVDGERARNIIRTALADGRDQLTTRESIDVLDAYGVRVCRAGFAADEDAAVAVADRIGYPVVMKMTSKTTSHKTDVGGVRVNIGSAEALRAEYRDLVAKLDERGLLDGLEGVIIQEMVKGSREMVCGIATDPQYGPMLMFGLGGVFVEVMKDVAFRIAPVTDTDARDMVRSVKAYKLLQGARGTTPADIAKVEETLLRLSQLVTDLPFIDELDINPLMISEKTGEPIAVDGRIKVRRCEAESALA